MATTDARPGFRLPWSADRNDSDTSQTADSPSAPESDQADDTATSSTETVAQDVTPAADPWGRSEPAHAGPAEAEQAEPAGTESSSAADPVASVPEAQTAARPVVDPWGGSAATTPSAPVAPKRKPNKLMADLTRAMQAAAEAARDETLERLQADAKAFVEGIHARSGEEATELRKRADDDIAAIREWSKAEIARIREETEHRIAGRKDGLEREVEAHAARIEERIERVQARVGAFESEMASFFERLLAEDDPTHLAAMAENLPEPPTFDDEEGTDLPPATAYDVPVAAPLAEPELATEVDALLQVPAVETTVETTVELAPEAAADTADAATDAVATEPAETAGEAVDAEAAFAAIQAAAEAAEIAEREAAQLAADDPAASESAEPAQWVEPGSPTEDSAEPVAQDPRLSALGLSAEAAAEAEAEAEVDATQDQEEIATFSDDALAARLAGLVPDEDDPHRAPAHSTRVVVTGLISVASIAGFKRQLGRLAGVSSVGVSSGPDGEFVFSVSHAADVSLAEAVPTLAEFSPTVTEVTDDTISVAARDPETDA